MGYFQWSFFIHNDVHFDIILFTGVISAAGIHLTDLLIMRNGQVDDLGNELLGGALAYEEPYLVEGS